KSTRLNSSQAEDGIRDLYVTGVQTWALRSEEHTSELQSRRDLVCRLLLEMTTAGCSSCLACSTCTRTLHMATPRERRISIPPSRWNSVPCADFFKRRR